MFTVKYNDETNNREIIDRNEMRAIISIVPFRWANDESFLFWHDPEVRKLKSWQLNGKGELQIE